MHTENLNNTLHSTDSKHSALDTLTTVIFYLAILFFIIGFNFSHNPAGNWYQQFMPNINGASIRDITFTDSLNGYSVTSIGGSNSYILKTTNSGDNWVIKFMHTQPFVRVHFINANTGFTNAFTTIYKTTNAGENWSPISLPGIFGDDMFVLSEDTIWLAMSESLTGGVFFTSNGGANWQNQLFLGNQNPNHVYFYNASLGFVGKDNIYLRRTSNGGGNWSEISGAGGFLDMYFTDSLTGWKTSFQKTTDGGFTWVNQVLPSGGNILGNLITNFSNINKDTIWANGGFVLFPNSQVRSILNRTTNGGQNWLFQIPDTSKIYNIVYSYTNFVNNNNGWATDNNPVRGGIHTTTGGNDTFFTPVTQISTEIPKEYKLFQNYPNPFNPVTNIEFRVSDFGLITLKIFDVTGKETAVLINEELKPGEYKTEWNASGFSSGIYFYSLIIDGKIIDTRKMMFIK
jgi:photosystem II stability/assembly factor-like uncharacterized protein